MSYCCIRTLYSSGWLCFALYIYTHIHKSMYIIRTFKRIRRVSKHYNEIVLCVLNSMVLPHTAVYTYYICMYLYMTRTRWKDKYIEFGTAECYFVDKQNTHTYAQTHQLIQQVQYKALCRLAFVSIYVMYVYVCVAFNISLD